VDACREACGVLDLGGDVLRFGVVFVIGVGKDFQNLPLMHCSVNEIDLKFQYRYAFDE
jgi:hypothetical protein